MESNHPKALEAKRVSELNRAAREAAKLLIQEAQGRGVRFVEIHPEPEHYEAPAPKRGHMTLAYIEDRRNVLAVASALCHPDDQFDKVKGRIIALRNLMDGRCIALRRPSNALVGTGEWLRGKFRTYGE